MITDRSAAVLAHGLGGSTDLPIPFTYALIGAAWALTFTFAVVALAWRRPRFDPDKPGRPLPPLGDDAGRRAGDPLGRRDRGAAVRGLGGDRAFFGPQDAEPAARRVLCVVVGRAGGPVAGVGPVWRAISPVRTVHRLLAGGRWVGAIPMGGLLACGRWPVRVRLARARQSRPGFPWRDKIWLLVYLAVTLAGALCCGERWCARADPFEVYSMVASRLSALRRNRDGRIAIGNPFDHLPSLPVRPGTVAVLAVLLGRRRSTASRRRRNGAASSTRPPGSAATATLIRSAGLLVFAGVVAATFWLAARATGGVDREQRRLLPGQMAHSLIPIVVGYVFAHYLTYLIERGQQTVILLIGHRCRRELLSVTSSFAAGHHQGRLRGGRTRGRRDRRTRQGAALLPKAHQLTGQLAMMLVMVGYTFTGLYLLFGG